MPVASEPAPGHVHTFRRGVPEQLGQRSRTGQQRSVGGGDIDLDGKVGAADHFVAGIDGVVDGNGTLLADGANPSGIPITNAVVNPTSVPGLPAWGVLPLSVALAGAALAARRRRG